jgi:hypothetical protein
MRTVREIGDQLYLLPPHAFTAARDAEVARAKSSGDRDLAKELSALKRPSIAGWLVNLVALRRADLVNALIELGHRMRTATALRDLSAQRRRQTDEIIAALRGLVAEAGEAAPTPALLSQVAATLAAAMADDDAAELVRTGRVLKPLAPGGLGPTGGAAVASNSSRTAAAAAPRDDQTASDQAARVRAAKDRLDRARAALAEAADAHEAANGAVDNITEEIAALRERLAQAERDARAARQARLAAEQEVNAALRQAARVGSTVE